MVEMADGSAKAAAARSATRARKTTTTRRKRLPSYLKKPLGRPDELHAIKKTLRARGLNTVCESAKCPNIGECFSKPTATFMILGDVCTRSCGFCAVGTKHTTVEVNEHEPRNIAITAREMALKHIVITSVTRDDLADGGAAQFAKTIRALRTEMADIKVEVLIPDFQGRRDALKTVIDAAPDIINHNLETVPRLYKKVRPKADYMRSLDLLVTANESGLFTKSGIMVGLGESTQEVKELLRDLACVGCDAVTIGQYLQPGRVNLEVIKYVAPKVFKEYEDYGRSIGISHVYSGPFVRSSYNAEDLFNS
jgi:lipoic acid synthetase